MPPLLSAIELFGTLFNRGSVSPAIKNTPVEESAQNLIGKSSKMEMAHEAVMLEDLRALAAKDRDDVARLKEKHLWKGQVDKAGADPMGDILVADDYKHVTNHVNGGASPLLTSLLTAGSLVAGMATYSMLNKPAVPAATQPAVVQIQPTVPANQQLDSEWDVETYLVDEKGNPIQPEQVVGRTRYRSRSGLVEVRQPDGTWKPAPLVKAP